MSCWKVNAVTQQPCQFIFNFLSSCLSSRSSVSLLCRFTLPVCLHVLSVCRGMSHHTIPPPPPPNPPTVLSGGNTHKYTWHKSHSSLSGFKSFYSPKTLTHRKSFQPDIAVRMICLQPLSLQRLALLCEYIIHTRFIYLLGLIVGLPPTPRIVV